MAVTFEVEFELDGRRYRAQSCPKHVAYYEAGYLVASCKRCTVERIPEPSNSEEGHRG